MRPVQSIHLQRNDQGNPHEQMQISITVKSRNPGSDQKDMLESQDRDIYKQFPRAQIETDL